jgi:tetratricopeptide (TPR) repeat protein
MIAQCGRALGAWMVLTVAALAHGDLHEQIANVTAQIQKSPESAELHLKRAELHRAHENWTAAAADYDRAVQLAPALAVVHLGRGKMFFSQGRFDEAKAELDQFLVGNPGQVDGFVTRARIEVKRGNQLAGAEDFARAIALSPRPEPEYYLERAQALAGAGDEHVIEALRCLDDGTAKLGNLPTLGLYAVELDTKRKEFDSALSRLERLSAVSQRKEAWLERRGAILQLANRSGEAQKAYREALVAIAALPARARQTKATAELQKRLTEKLASGGRASPP